MLLLQVCWKRFGLYLHPGWQIFQHILQPIFIKVCQEPDTIRKASPSPCFQTCT